MCWAWDALAFLVVGSSTSPVPDCADPPAAEHQRDSGITIEDGAYDNTECHESDVEGVPGVCHGGDSA